MAITNDRKQYVTDEIIIIFHIRKNKISYFCHFLTKSIRSIGILPLARIAELIFQNLSPCIVCQVQIFLQE